MKTGIRTMASMAVLSLLAAKAEGQLTSPFHADRVVARADSFVILVQGTPRGFMTEAIERSDSGFTLRSVQEITPMMSQRTEVEFSHGLEMRAVRQTGEARGAPMRIDVAYSRGRARGSATTPGPAGMKSIEVDAVFPAGAVDDNVLMALLPTLTLSPGTSYSVRVFASGQGKLQEIMVAVGEKEAVTVVAGAFHAYPVTVTGGPVPVTFHVSDGSVPRVVRMTMGGSPISFELATR